MITSGIPGRSEPYFCDYYPFATLFAFLLLGEFVKRVQKKRLEPVLFDRCDPVCAESVFLIYKYLVEYNERR